MVIKFIPHLGGLNVLEDEIECGSFTVISIESLLVYKSKILPASIFIQLRL